MLFIVRFVLFLFLINNIILFFFPLLIMIDSQPRWLHKTTRWQYIIIWFYRRTIQFLWHRCFIVLNVRSVRSMVENITGIIISFISRCKFKVIFIFIYFMDFLQRTAGIKLTFLHIILFLSITELNSRTILPWRNKCIQHSWIIRCLFNLLILLNMLYLLSNIHLRYTVNIASQRILVFGFKLLRLSHLHFLIFINHLLKVILAKVYIRLESIIVSNGLLY